MVIQEHLHQELIKLIMSIQTSSINWTHLNKDVYESGNTCARTSGWSSVTDILTGLAKQTDSLANISANCIDWSHWWCSARDLAIFLKFDFLAAALKILFLPSNLILQYRIGGPNLHKFISNNYCKCITTSILSYIPLNHPRNVDKIMELRS